MPVPAPKGVQDITGFFLHRLPAQAVHTAGTGSDRVLRIMVTVGGNDLNDRRRAVVETVRRPVAPGDATP